MPFNEEFEILEAIEPEVAKLMAEHKERRKPWYFHELVPWELGRNFKAEPWDESQCTINERARTSLVLNLLTEDNLPSYHLALHTYLPQGSVWKDWTALWTAEEGQHSIAIRSYLLTSRNCDPKDLEDDRMATMVAGWAPSTGTRPAEMFAYTAAQELATRVSHRNAGKITEDEVAFDLMCHIAADENHHYMFYKGALAAVMEQDATHGLEGLYTVLSNFQMPGVGIPGFLRRSIEVARAGVYSLRIHHDRVVMPLLEQLGVPTMTGLSKKGSEYQEKLMDLTKDILEKAERFEARFG